VAHNRHHGEYPKVRHLVRPRAASAYRDLDFLKYILKAPLQFDYEKGGYYYTEKYKLPQIRTTEGELVGMLLLDQLRRTYDKTDIGPLVEHALELLSREMDEMVTIDSESMDQVLQVEIEPFPQIDIKVFQDLLQAIRNSESIIIKYFSGQKAVVVEKPCDPYHLLNFKDNWYLVAFCHEKQDFRDFLCSRIMSVERTNTTFLPDPDFSLEEHKKQSQLFAAEARRSRSSPSSTSTQRTGSTGRRIPASKWWAQTAAGGQLQSAAWRTSCAGS
jgi:predicted DNA-binding transcriptional regulator YafY